MFVHDDDATSHSLHSLVPSIFKFVIVFKFKKNLFLPRLNVFCRCTPPTDLFIHFLNFHSSSIIFYLVNCQFDYINNFDQRSKSASFFYPGNVLSTVVLLNSNFETPTFRYPDIQTSNMTKAACNLIINITKVCLIYRSIKALKRSGTKITTTTNLKNNNDHHVVVVQSNPTTDGNDLEILQLWSLFASLTIYNQSGIESIISMFIPLYYYFKMILILITVIPSTKFPNFWCEILLIPMMSKCHEMMDLDWNSIVQREMIMMPWRILDVTIMPGLLCDEETVEEVKRRRWLQMKMRHVQNVKDIMKDIPNNNNHHQEVKGEESKEKVIMIENISDESNDYNDGNNNGNISPSSINNTSHHDSSFTSPVARSRVAASSLHLRKFSRDHKNHNYSPHHHHLPARGGVSVPPMSAFQRNTILTTATTIDENNPSLDDDQEYITTNSLIDDDDEYYNNDTNNNHENNNDEKRRESLNHRIRNFITGDSNIRIRDYLFDVDLPSVPSRDSISTTNNNNIINTNLSISPSKTFDSEYVVDDDFIAPPPTLTNKVITNNKELQKRDDDELNDHVTIISRQKKKNGSPSRWNDNDNNNNNNSGSSGNNSNIKQSKNVTTRRSQRLAKR